ncbi:ECF RNA polymerase sigma factor SigK [Streptomyces sp. ADI96-15]|uniref:RNA polymerase sigma factor n=1 Tax=Streptomyces TaxID=1883 RepID=UPI0003C2F6A0|nr:MULTISPECIES: sigma-70 family RNA polymerase sigma factor [unclassified Streptomyces]ESP99472.1 RNA polymerase ECF-subfamily sigma factor [Streptomyces sp. GBA 94-10 4N24]ESQ06467.1 RNA polymerase ECF-subfamily sigma factor [Streptomyces sp. PVA_94-07]RPK57360.1 ECF RNA polymerase sigma factor SigK [Streptomyces sp. ADI96-15]UZN59372.1 RNA polymerase ECF-subfamily sigma factor [Streptomyces sp. GBA 94-10 4N24]
MTPGTPRDRDRLMRDRLLDGEAAALGELYDRYAPLVHSLAHRVLEDERAADRVTRDVFTHAWERPGDYTPGERSLRSWIASLAHHRAVELLRATGAAEHAVTGHGSAEELERTVHRAATAARADYIVTAMPAPLRAALNLAYHQRRDHRQTAAALGVSEEEVRRRLRLGLQMLATAGVPRPPGAPSTFSGAI